ncbi:hypothetical protein [Roseimaritima multifibrata]|uniref:hypothetical protein n=1 Tax=Roseimaritima multifibrata TaxID=1930274 RepID=UPI0011A2901B|nr:hypothetical protein [Roseimaritima multifibrata]
MDSRRFIAVLALSAYLFGGWLLPLTHRHDHQAHFHGVDGVCLTADGSDSHAGHSHSAAESCLSVCSAAIDDSGAESLGSVGQQLASHAACEGLCVLCQSSTRQFVGSHALASHFVLVPRTEFCSSVSDSVKISAFSCSDRPRGPPARLV